MSNLISRADAIEAVCRKCSAETRMDCALGICSCCDRRELEALPSADAVQGEWIDVENEPYCECSVCGAYIDNLDDDYAFCPRCGARMKGGEDE